MFTFNGKRRLPGLWGKGVIVSDMAFYGFDRDRL